MKKRSSHRVPGSVNEGQNHREKWIRSSRSAIRLARLDFRDVEAGLSADTGREFLPDVVPVVVHVGRQGALAVPDVEVGLVDDHVRHPG